MPFTEETKIYCKNLWQGRQSLLLTTLFHVILPTLFAIALLRFFRESELSGFNKLLLVAIPLVLAFAALSLATALVSANRKQRILAGPYGANTNIALFNIATLIAAAATVFQTVDFYTASNHRATMVKVHDFSTLKIERDGTHPERLHVYGEIGIASTRELAKALAGDTPTTLVVLDSEGGNIFEARGIARLIREHGLATHVEGKCFSACTLAFVNGSVRTASTTAKFGFHAYRLEAVYPNSNTDLESEQESDRQMFADQGVSKPFSEKIFQASHEEMWFPQRQTLLDAGYLTGSEIN